MDPKKKKPASLFAAPLPKGAPTMFHTHVEQKNLLDELSATVRVKRVLTGEIASLAGPKGDDYLPEEYSQAFAQVISLYPMNTKLGIREGDPICDSYRIHTSDTGSIWCLADGCNWGQRPFQAANRCAPPPLHTYIYRYSHAKQRYSHYYSIVDSKNARQTTKKGSRRFRQRRPSENQRNQDHQRDCTQQHLLC